MDDNQLAFVTAFLGGQTLSALRGRSSSESIRELELLILANVLAGLAHAHAERDRAHIRHIGYGHLTPHNVFLGYDGEVQLVDLGMAKLYEPTKDTVRYLAHEQALDGSLDQRIDRRVDLFAVGVMLWEAATGRRMWEGHSDDEVIQILASGVSLPSPRQVRADVPLKLDSICEGALAVRPSDRYPTAVDFKADLDDFLDVSGLVRRRREVASTIGSLFTSELNAHFALLESAGEGLPALWSDEEVVSEPIDRLAEPDDDDGDGEPGGETTVTPLLLNPFADELEDSVPTRVHASFAQLTKAPPEPQPEQDAVYEAPFGSGSHVLEASPPAVAASGSGRSMIRVAIGVTVVLTLLVGTTLALVRRGMVARAVPMPEPRKIESTTPGGGTDLSPSRAGEIVELTFSATPASARFSIDEGALLANPFHGQVTRDDKEHSILVVAIGYAPQTAKVRFSEDVVLQVSLETLGSGQKASVDPAIPAQPPPAIPAQPPPPSLQAAPSPTRAPPTAKPAVATPPHQKALDTGDPWTK